MADLVVDSKMLHDLNVRLQFVLQNLEQATPISRETAAACASGGLAETVRDFADDWDDNREDLLESIREISQMVNTVDDGFRKMDAELRNVLLRAAEG